MGPLRGANIGSADVIRFAGSPRGGQPAGDACSDAAAVCRSLGVRLWACGKAAMGW